MAAATPGAPAINRRWCSGSLGYGGHCERTSTYRRRGPPPTGAVCKQRRIGPDMQAGQSVSEGLGQGSARPWQAPYQPWRGLGSEAALSANTATSQPARRTGRATAGTPCSE
jgi:hypothetical protein